MISLKQLSHFLAVTKNNWQDVSWWKGSIKAVYFRYIIRNRGTAIMTEDWDNLIILDACRYDMFKELNNLSGVLEYRISRGSCTSEFLRKNFGGKKYSDTIYITGNPLVDYWVPNCFYKIIQVWKDGWDEYYETVLPKTMVEYALEAEREYPDKHLIIHFVQPHYPFLGEKARKEIGDHAGITMARKEAMGDKHATHRTQPIWDLLKQGKVKKETVWNAYKENLQIALPYVKELADKLRGKTVVSADHANLFAERILPLLSREYGHPCGVHTKNLVKVPWLVIEEGKGRKKINDEKIIKGVDEKEIIKEKIRRLKALRACQKITCQIFKNLQIQNPFSVE